MQLAQAVELIDHPAGQEENIWADLGCGDGLFTNALSQLLVDDSLIYAVDKNKTALNKVSVKDGIQLKKLELDFINNDLPLKYLSGILMANSFHFVRHKTGFIEKLLPCLNTSGYFLIVEYDTDAANTWVPYPVSFDSLKDFFAKFNYTTKKLHRIPSRYNGIIYSAIVSRHPLPGVTVI
jgi:trans-aconitate methyltransferase